MGTGPEFPEPESLKLGSDGGVRSLGFRRECFEEWSQTLSLQHRDRDDGFFVVLPKPQVQEQLTEVNQIWASSRAFAAVRTDGRLVTWGDALHGGDSRAIEGQLNFAVEPLPSAEVGRVGSGERLFEGQASSG